MRNFVLILMSFFVGVSLYSQSFPINEQGEIEFTEVVEANIPKEKLYSNAKEWVAKTFGDYKAVIQFEDDKELKLIVKGISKINHMGGDAYSAIQEKISYTLTVECKEGKYRYKLNDILVNATYTLLGTTVNYKPFSPSKHLINLQTLNDELKVLKETNLTNLKKKAIAEHENKIIRKQNEVNDENIFYKEEFKTVLELIASLKVSMHVNDNW